MAKHRHDAVIFTCTTSLIHADLQNKSETNHVTLIHIGPTVSYHLSEPFMEYVLLNTATLLVYLLPIVPFWC
jgi:hypothetical protein